MKVINVIALLLAIVGAVNWGLWGVYNFDAVAYLFDGNTSMVSRIVYSLVGVAGVYCISLFPLVVKNDKVGE